MLLAVSDRLPQAYAYCFSVFSQSSFLFHGPFTILSQEGIPQGDPLGPLLFRNTIQPLILSLNSSLNLGYLDDLSVGEPQFTVAHSVGSSLGFQLNTCKCELICHPDYCTEEALLRSFETIHPKKATLLGAPLFPGSSLDQK